MIRQLIILLTLVSIFGCIKTAEQVQREKRFDSMSEQVKDSQGLMAELLDQMKDTQAQLDRMNGRLEELEHKQKKVNPESIQQMNETVSLLKTQQETESAKTTLIQNELKELRGFIEKITNSLSAQKSDDRNQKKNAKDALATALGLVKNNMYGEARAELEGLLDHSTLTAGDKNKVLHGLGRVEFYTKNFDKALVYFSKIYSKYPKSSLASSSLLFIGKSLEALNKKDESVEAFKKVLEDYPGTKEASEAKKKL